MFPYNLPRDVRVDLRLLLDIAGVIHSESVEEIHEDDSCEEDEAEEENVGQHPVVGGTVDGNVTELQFTNKLPSPQGLSRTFRQLNFSLR